MRSVRYNEIAPYLHPGMIPLEPTRGEEQVRTKFTFNLINKLKPQAREYEVRDTEIKGLALRVYPTGKMMYTLVYSRGRRVNLGPAHAIDHDQARVLARQELAKHYSGKDPIKERQQVKAKADNYLQFLEDIYKPWLLLNIVNGLATYESLKTSFPEFHKLNLNGITPGLIEKWRLRRLKEGIKPSSINRQMNDLRACLNRAINIWELIKENPFQKVKPCKTDTSPKVRYLTKTEEGRLSKALDDREQTMKDARNRHNEWLAKRGYQPGSAIAPSSFADHLKPAVLLSLHTGLRRGELFQLKWENVDLERKNLTVAGETSRKSGKTRHIPLNDSALGVLKRWKKQRSAVSPYVFHDAEGRPFEGVETSFRGVLREAGITNFRWHDLRHTFASKLVMAGVNLNTVRELLGHSDYKMTLRYAHLSPEHKAAAVKKLVGIQLRG